MPEPYEMTLKQYRANDSAEIRREYGITVAEYEEWYPYRELRSQWIEACQNAVEIKRIVLKSAVMDALVREIGEAKVLYIFRGPRMDMWPKGYDLPSVRRTPMVKLYQPRRRRAS